MKHCLLAGGPAMAMMAAVTMTAAPITFAGDVTVVEATLRPGGGNTFSADVTLEHADTGWDHYADGWRVLGPDGAVLGSRTLHHPHVDEQPFTRSLSGIEIPAGIDEVMVEAHDSVHGWAAQRLTVKVPR